MKEKPFKFNNMKENEFRKLFYIAYVYLSKLEQNDWQTSLYISDTRTE